MLADQSIDCLTTTTKKKNNMTNEKDYINFIIDILDYLDGRGIVFEDEDLVRKELHTISQFKFHSRGKTFQIQQIRE